MKYLTYLAASVALFTLIACGNGKSANETEISGTTGPVAPLNTTLQPQTTPVDLNSQTTPYSQTTPSTTVTPANTTIIPANTTVAPGMNPPHGQPGHRCDIAVGAPLNSAPAQQPATAVTTPATTPINISTDKLTQPVVATAPGMNPPHGQPGHRCDIAVGAPLNSAPTQPATTATPVPTPVTISADKLTQPVTTAVAPGMNPPHGQPGHRCDIAVGAPLNSKPVTVAGIPSTNTVTSSSTIPAVVPVNPVTAPTKQNQ